MLVDIRPIEQRRRDGEVPGALIIDRNVLEWRLDPQGDHRIPEAARTDRRIMVLCNEGYASSLAAATLRQLGLDATDVVGGFVAWAAAGSARLIRQRGVARATASAVSTPRMTPDVVPSLSAESGTDDDVPSAS